MAPLVLRLRGTIYLSRSRGDGTIGEYTTSGGTVNASLITKLYGSAGSGAWGVAISGNDLFVANYNDGIIGEYTTSGAIVNASLITGLTTPNGIAIFGNDLFVVSFVDGTVGEYTTSGAIVNASLITGLDSPTDIAITPEPSSVALAGLGAATLWLWGRRK